MSALIAGRRISSAEAEKQPASQYSAELVPLNLLFAEILLEACDTYGGLSLED